MIRGFLAVVLVLPSLSLTASEVLEAQVPREEVASVDFTGNEAFSDPELRRAILTQPTHCPLVLRLTTCAIGLDWGKDRFFFSPRGVEADRRRLQELYRAHGYWQVQVDTVLTRTSSANVGVEFRIAEGQPRVVDSIVVEGDPLPDGLTAEDFPLQPGGPLSYLLMNETRDLITNELRNNGYARAEVFKRARWPRESNRARVVFTVDRGPESTFGPIEVVGTNLLDDDAVKRRLPFREGRTYRRDQIAEAQRSLYGLDIISRASVIPDTSGFGAVIPVRVEIAEGDARRVRTGGGINTADCLNVEGTWTSRNFFGAGRRLQARGRVSNLLTSQLSNTPLCAESGVGEFGKTNWLLSVDFTQPSFLSPRTSLFAGAFGERQSLKNIFVRDAFGLNLGATQDLGRNSFLSLRYQPQLDRLDAAEATLCATFLACGPADIDVLQDANWLAPITLSFSQERTDQILNPTTGFRALLDLEVADGLTGSDFAYFRTVADGSLYRPLNRRSVLAMRLRVGRIAPGGFEGFQGGPSLSDEIVPPQKRFFGGGASATRGFAQSTLGPRSLSVAVGEVLRSSPEGTPACTPESVADLSCDASALLDRSSSPFQVRPSGGLGTVEGSLELRFDITDGALGGAVFVDVGQVWPEGVEFDDIEITPGVGVRYNTLFGPFRLDIAYSFRGKEPLQVVTSRIRPFDPGSDDPLDQINTAPKGSPAERIPWVISEDLALLEPRLLFGDDPGFSFRRFQIHFSIGQAF